MTDIAIKEYQKQWREKNKDKVLGYIKKHKESHGDEIRKKDRQRIKALRMMALEILGGKCVVCGIDDYRCLNIDHISGGGSKINRGHGQRTMLKRIINDDISGLQLLCANHNQIKRYECEENIINDNN
jgi:hypothetical protein